LGDAFDVTAGLDQRRTDLVCRLRNASSLAAMLQRLEARITVEQQRLSIAFTRTELASLLDSSIDDDEAVTLTADVMFKPRGHELRLVYAAPDARPTVRDDHLIRLLARYTRIIYTLINTTFILYAPSSRRKYCTNS